MYDGRVAGSVAEAEALMQSVPRETLTPRLESAAEFLQANWHPRLGVVGFSLGAAFALELAPRVGAEAAVIYYGLGEVDLSSWDTPLLGHFARVDEWEPLGEVEALFARFKEAGHDPELVVHEDAGHWFANTDVPEAADPVAAGRAWGATVEFLRYHLA
jgi:carboxymethylenebutenolidase